VKASDCHGAFTPVTFCNTVYGDAGYSCLDGQCIVECADQAGTTCAVEHATECLQCPPTASCIPPSCPASTRVTTFHVEDAQCRGTSPLAPREEIIEGPSEACGMTLSRVVDGGTQRIGALFLQDARAITANVPLLGGRCNVLELPTGAERLLLDCPLCQVVLGP
jgi:hypothetical protein